MIRIDWLTKFRSHLKTAWTPQPSLRRKRTPRSSVPAMIELLEPRKVLSASSITVTGVTTMGNSVTITGTVGGPLDYGIVSVLDQTNQEVGSGSLDMGTFHVSAYLSDGNHQLSILTTGPNLTTGMPESAWTQFTITIGSNTPPPSSIIFPITLPPLVPPTPPPSSIIFLITLPPLVPPTPPASSIVFPIYLPPLGGPPVPKFPTLTSP